MTTHAELEGECGGVLLGQLHRPARARSAHVLKLDLGPEHLLADAALGRNRPLRLDPPTLAKLGKAVQRRPDGVLQLCGIGARAPRRVVVIDDRQETLADPSARDVLAVLEVQAGDVRAEERRLHVGVGGDSVGGDGVCSERRDEVVTRRQHRQDVGSE